MCRKIDGNVLFSMILYVFESESDHVGRCATVLLTICDDLPGASGIGLNSKQLQIGKSLDY